MRQLKRDLTGLAVAREGPDTGEAPTPPLSALSHLAGEDGTMWATPKSAVRLGAAAAVPATPYHD